jgi:hypothetical protein
VRFRAPLSGYGRTSASTGGSALRFVVSKNRLFSRRQLVFSLAWILQATIPNPTPLATPKAQTGFAKLQTRQADLRQD